MDKKPWQDNELRIHAEKLITEHGLKWPNPCSNIACTFRPRRWVKNSVDGKAGHKKRVFRCACKGETVNCATVIAMLQPIADATPTIRLPSSAAVASAPSVIFTQPAPARSPVRPQLGSDPLTLDDLASVHTAQESDFDEDDEDVPSQLSSWQPSTLSPGMYQSPLVLGPSQRPSQFVSPPEFTNTFSFPTMPSSFVYQSPQQHMATPSAPSTMSPPYHHQSPLQPVLGKRAAMAKSVWGDKQHRSDRSSEELDAAVSKIGELERQLAQQQALNQTLEQEKSSLLDALNKAHARFDAQDQAIAEQAKSLHDLQLLVARLGKARADPVPAASTSSAKASSSPPAAAPVVAAAAPVKQPIDSYVAAARSGLSADQLEVIKAMRPAPRPFQARTGAPRVVAPGTPTVRVYFGNMQSCPLRVFKERLRALRVRTSAIPNIAFVGRSICEFLVEASYKDALIAKLTACTFRYLPNYDPSRPQDPNVSPEARARVQEAYAQRLRTTAGTTTRPVVREVFMQLMVAANLPIPADLPDMTVAAAGAAGAGDSAPAEAAAGPVAAVEAAVEPTETATEAPAAAAAQSETPAEDQMDTDV